MPKKTKRPVTASGARKPVSSPPGKQTSGNRSIDAVATLKDLRKATHHTQEDLALIMGVGQGTVSRIEKRHDMLVSTLQHYVESVGGTLQLLVSFPDRPPLHIERLGKKPGAPVDVPVMKTGGKRPPHD